MTHIQLVPDDVLHPHDAMHADDMIAHTSLMDDTNHLIAVLERHRAKLPFADRELLRYQSMRQELETSQNNSEHALNEWRSALTERWECEIAALRLYMALSSTLSNTFGDDSPYMQVVALTRRGDAASPEDLLNDLKRIHATLSLIQPSLDGIADCLVQLGVVCRNLEDSIATTLYWEEQRRSAVIGQRFAYDAYQRACSKTRHMLVQYLGDQVVRFEA